METKTISALKALTYTFETTLQNMMTDAGNLPAEIMEKASSLNLQLAGPQIWIYNGCYGEMDKPFELTIAQPVTEEKGYPGKFQFGKLAEMKACSTVHKGAWNKIGETYCSLMADLEKEGLRFTGYSREVYHLCDFENQENNITEILVEVN